MKGRTRRRNNGDDEFSASSVVALEIGTIASISSSSSSPVRRRFLFPSKEGMVEAIRFILLVQLKVIRSDDCRKTTQQWRKFRKWLIIFWNGSIKKRKKENFKYDQLFIVIISPSLSLFFFFFFLPLSPSCRRFTLIFSSSSLSFLLSRFIRSIQKPWGPSIYI